MQTFPPVAAAAVIVDGDRALERRLVGFYTRETISARLLYPINSSQSAAKDAAARHREWNRPDRLAEFADRMDRAARLSMTCALRELGLFSDPEVAYSTEGLLT